MKLQFFSPHPFSESLGVDIFAQQLSMEQNYYVFPHLSSLVLFSSSLNADVQERRWLPQTILQGSTYWWPILNSMCTESLLMGKKDGQGAILFLLEEGNVGMQGHSFGIFMLLDLFLIFLLDPLLKYHEYETFCFLSTLSAAK